MKLADAGEGIQLSPCIVLFFFFFFIPDTWWSSSHCHQVPGAPAHECVSYWNMSTSKRPERGSPGVKGTLLFVTREGRGGFTRAQNLCLAPSGQEEVDGCGARGRGTFFVFVFGHITFSPFLILNPVDVLLPERSKRARSPPNLPRTSHWHEKSSVRVPFGTSGFSSLVTVVP